MPKSAVPMFFNHLEIALKIESRVLQEDLEKITSCIRAQSYYMNGLCLEKIDEVDGHHISSIRFSQERRGITLTVGKTLILIRYLHTHKYPDSDKLRVACRAFLKQYQSDPSLVCRKISIEPSEQEIPKAKFILKANQTSIALDEEQIESCYITLPAKICGRPGAGKSLAGLVRLMNQLHGESAYYASSPFLVKKQRDLLEEQGLPSHSEAIRYFLSSEDLYPAAQTFSAEEVLLWVRDMIGQSSSVLHSLNPIYIVQELQTLYVLQKLFPEDFGEHYKKNFARPSFYTPSQVSAMEPLYHGFTERFLCSEAKPFVRGFVCRDPIPGRLFALFVSDENQNQTVAENLFFFSKTENAQALFLRDMKQSQDWQGVDPLGLLEAILHTYFTSQHKEPLRIASVELKKGYRNSAAVTELANRMLRLQNIWLNGTVIKDEAPLFEYTQSADPVLSSGAVRLYTGVDTSEFDNIRQYFPENSTQWAVLTTVDGKAEARDIFGPNVLIFDTQDLPGLEFLCTVCWNTTDRSVLAEQEEEPLDELIANPGMPLNLNRSPILSQKGDLIRASSTAVTIISRAVAGVLVVERPVEFRDYVSRKKHRVVEKALRWLYPSEQYGHHDAPWTINMRASTFDEWEVFIRDLWARGVKEESRRLFDLHIQPHTAISFSIWAGESLLPEAVAIFTEPGLSPAAAEETMTQVELCTTTPVETYPQKVSPPKKDSPKKSKLRKIVSPQNLCTIRNLVHTKDYSIKTIRIESVQDLNAILFANTLLLQSDIKNPILCTDTENENAVSLCSALAVASQPVQKIILKKLEALFSLGHVRKISASKAFFEVPCPESLEKFLRTNGVLGNLQNLGQGLFWMIVQIPQIAFLLELALGIKSNSLNRVTKEARVVAEFLHADWTEHIGASVTQDHIESAGCQAILNFFQIHMHWNLDLTLGTERHPTAILYNIVGAKTDITADILLAALSGLTGEQITEVISYKSSRTGLTALDTLQKRKDINNLSVVLNILERPEDYDLHSFKMPKAILDIFWKEWLTSDFYVLHGLQNDRITMRRILDIAIWGVNAGFYPQNDSASLSNALKFFLCGGIDKEYISCFLRAFNPYSSNICAYENEVILPQVNFKNQYQSIQKDFSRRHLIDICLYMNQFSVALEIFESGFTTSGAPDLWRARLERLIEGQAPIDLIHFMLSQHSNNSEGCADVLGRIIYNITDPYYFYEQSIYDASVVEMILKNGANVFSQIPLRKRLPVEFMQYMTLWNGEKYRSQINKGYIGGMAFAYILLIAKGVEMRRVLLSFLYKALQDGVEPKIAAWVLEKLDIAITPQTHNRNKKTLFSECLNDNNPITALLFLHHGADIISHVAKDPCPLTVSLSRVSAYQDSWSELSIELIDKLKNAGIQYPMTRYMNLFRQIVQDKNFIVATHLLNSEILDWQGWSKETAQPALSSIILSLAPMEESEELNIFARAFIRQVDKNELLDCLYIGGARLGPSPMNRMNIIVFALYQSNLLLFNAFLETVPQILIKDIATPDDLNFILLQLFLSEAKKNLIEPMALSLLRTLEKLYPNPLFLGSEELRAVQKNTIDCPIFWAIYHKLFTVVDRLLAMGAGLTPPRREMLLLMSILSGAPRQTVETILLKTAGENDVATYLSEEILQDFVNTTITLLSGGGDVSEKTYRTNTISYFEVTVAAGNVDALRVFFEHGYLIPLAIPFLKIVIDRYNIEILRVVLEEMNTSKYPHLSDQSTADAIEYALLSLCDSASSGRIQGIMSEMIVMLMRHGLPINENAKKLISVIGEMPIGAAISQALNDRILSEIVQPNKALVLSTPPIPLTERHIFSRRP